MCPTITVATERIRTFLIGILLFLAFKGKSAVWIRETIEIQPNSLGLYLGSLLLFFSEHGE